VVISTNDNIAPIIIEANNDLTLIINTNEAVQTIILESSEQEDTNE
jgi:hypothetical protein